MRWKVVTAMLLLALNNITYAQIADVSGVGEDRDSALRDAKRNAVEQVVGTYINSETLVSQASVVSDEIYDILFSDLQTLESWLGLRMKNSPIKKDKHLI